jgi:branched-chain amino acid transport system substrate-binding protein
LSGENAAIAAVGKGILDAAQMALFDSGGNSLALLPRDTGGTARGAAAAARAAIGDGAQLILGPLLATEVEAVKPVAEAKHLNVIAFSTVTQLAGGNVFLMGFLPQQEVAREVDFAHQQGIGRFAALAPNSAYGRVTTDALRAAAGADSSTVTEVVYYDPAGGDAGQPIRRLLAGGAAAAAGTPPAGPPFDALLLPESGDRLRAIARALVAAGLDTKAVRLLGSGVWDEPDIGSEPALRGGWFAAPSPEGRQAFVSRFQAAYGTLPPNLAALGYDAAALAAVLVKSEVGVPFSRSAILNPNGFTGVDGLFRFRDNGLVQRGLAVLEVDPQGTEVVSPAPQTFADTGF